jgi:hypothetical protein
LGRAPHGPVGCEGHVAPPVARRAPRCRLHLGGSRARPRSGAARRRARRGAPRFAGEAPGVARGGARDGTAVAQDRPPRATLRAPGRRAKHPDSIRSREHRSLLGALSVADRQSIGKAAVAVGAGAGGEGGGVAGFGAGVGSGLGPATGGGRLGAWPLRPTGRCPAFSRRGRGTVTFRPKAVWRVSRERSRSVRPGFKATGLRPRA